ncbi:uncharacterized protein [Equus caballus]|uniref:uncharacterized protein n=1 Tax=Equus caballus TaxID=9796 RepID=UPI001D0550D6|nr:uncharacterized protein LOC123280008 [Equus asinus]
MEPETPTLSSPCLDLHSSPVELHENTEFCEEGITYTAVKVQNSSNTQKRKITRISKSKGSPWCVAAVVFALLYLIFLALAAIMTAKVHCLEETLKELNISDTTTYCKLK